MLENITYTDTFFSELNPHAIRCTALMRGFEVPDSLAFTYCELGCGTGHSLLVFAAANPLAHFTGIDFNEEHIAFAQARADRLGIKNCTFIYADITNIASLPRFDYIVLHGLYTWVHEHVRQSIHRIVESSLNPKGLVLVSYNAYPGWHILEPMRMMFREYSMHLSDDPFYNAEQGIGFLEWMHEQQCEYMKVVPSAGEFIKELSKHDLRYIIHEYYADNWTPLWFKEMNQKMQNSGLSFAGQLPFFLNIGAIALPEGFEEILTIGDDLLQFETYKDLIRNTMFRWDIYANGERTISNPLELLDFGRVTPQEYSLNDIQLPGCKIFTLEEEIHTIILAELESGQSHVHKLSASLNLDATIIEDALLNLLIAEQIKPIVSIPASELDAKGMQSILISFLEEALLCEEHTIPSVLSGSGIIINKDTALFLLATIKHQENAIDWIAEWMEIHGYGDSQQTKNQAEKAYEVFASTIPFWKRMQIL